MTTPQEMQEIDSLQTLGEQQVLKIARFLQTLGEQQVLKITRMAQLKELDEKTVVFRQGQDSPFIYIVLDGKIGLHVDEPDGTTVEIATLGPGELLGWSPVLGRYAMTATARARTRCRLAALD